MNQTNGNASTLIDLLRERAQREPDARIYSYLVDGEVEGAHLSHGALDRQARAIGAMLQGYHAAGERALMLYPAGLEFISAFFGCLYAGVTAVPVPHLNIAQPQRTLARLLTISSDAQPTLVLTTASILSKVEGLFAQAPELRAMRWIATDQIPDDAASNWRDPAVTGSALALLQYTSGSTAVPRGVMVTHENIMRNCAHIKRAFEITADSVSVMWLPVFHDMGLTNGIIQPIYSGRLCVLMPPQSFLQRPLRWIQAISRYHATISGGPNFAYDMCARRITPEQRAGLDLSSWRVAYNGAEPVRADTLKRFAEAFASCGFRPRSSYPCYGLAEATLIVSGGQVDDDPVLCTTRVAALDHNAIAAASDPHQIVRTLVGCGRAMHGTKIIVVHPETMLACAPDEIGEIWVSSPSVAQGYWKRPDETAYTFNAFRSDTREGPYLRTGDLGFLKDGELFVTGRLKDLIIIGGRNLYPNDIELTVEQSHASVRSGGCAAFSVDVTDDERLIVAAEVERRQAADPARANGVDQTHSANGYRRNPWTHEGLDAVVRAIRRAVSEQHDIRVHAVVLLRAGGIPRTPSGKVQRRICQAQFRDGTLERSAQSE